MCLGVLFSTSLVFFFGLFELSAICIKLRNFSSVSLLASRYYIAMFSKYSVALPEIVIHLMDI